MPFSIETFGAGHSLVTNKLPKRVNLSMLETLGVDRKPEISQFGLFEASSPDFNKYYPDVTADDLTPDEKDFVNPVFRALSKVIINKYGPIDFTQGDVLERSAKGLIGQAIFTNHEQIVGNEVGVITEAFFEKQRTYDGVTIPAGINVRMKLDGKSNPKLVRSIMMDPPSVHSTSVTVAFNWEQSHKNLSADEFYNMMGKLDDKGKLIRRVVTDIARYEELSLVSHGADPFAQKVGTDGKIVNPAYAGKVYKFSEGDNRQVYHFMDWKESGTSTASFSLSDTIPATDNLSNSLKPDEQLNNQQKPMNEQLLQFLRTFFGLDANATEAQVTAKLQAELPLFAADRASLGQIKTELTQAKDSFSNLQQKYPEGSTVISKEDKEKLDAHAALKASLDSVVGITRAECLKLYHLSVGGSAKADAAITKLIAESSLESLGALTKQYKAQVEKSFTATCNSCGGTNITRASSASSEDGIVLPGAGDPEPIVVKNTLDVANELHRKATAQTVDAIHGKSIKK